MHHQHPTLEAQAAPFQRSNEGGRPSKNDFIVRHSGLSSGAILPLPVSLNARLHLPPLKASSFQGLFAPSSGSENVA